MIKWLTEETWLIGNFGIVSVFECQAIIEKEVVWKIE